MCRIKELSQKYSGNVKFFLVDVLLLKKKKKRKVQENPNFASKNWIKIRDIFSQLNRIRYACMKGAETLV